MVRILDSSPFVKGVGNYLNLRHDDLIHVPGELVVIQEKLTQWRHFWLFISLPKSEPRPALPWVLYKALKGGLLREVPQPRRKQISDSVTLETSKPAAAKSKRTLKKDWEQRDQKKSLRRTAT